ncbi:uncharacterized protein LOC142775467 [Rhipicephalus microplus]|uniref:uncharacterized protein LOC142775467 n=1 Tax=Rhipicephalus microplus TaxID=6941 RepID=UPI003F6A89AC
MWFEHTLESHYCDCGSVGFFESCESAFRPRRCTFDSLADVIAILEEAKYHSDYGILVLLDVRSAFDCLPHALILDALRDLGVCRRVFDYLESVWGDHTLRVRVGSTISGPQPVSGGVPQATIGLHPRNTACEPHLAIYADDIALFACDPGCNRATLLEFLQMAIDAVDAFLGEIELALTAFKTEALLVQP